MDDNRKLKALHHMYSQGRDLRDGREERGYNNINSKIDSWGHENMTISRDIYVDMTNNKYFTAEDDLLEKY